MKKRLKNLLALCMVAMMMLAMSTGVVSAETYYANMADGGVYQYIVDKNHQNDPRILYRGVPNTGTIAMNPGDIIVPFELTGTEKSGSGGKHDDFCGKPFFIVKSVEKDNSIQSELSSKYITDKWGELEKVYKYDDSPKWNGSNKITCELDTNEILPARIPLEGGEPVDNTRIQKMIEVSGDSTEAAMMQKFKFYDKVALDPEDGIINPVSIETLIKNNTEVNCFTDAKMGTVTICSALKLPACDNGRGYHYNVRKVSASVWDNTYAPGYDSAPSEKNSDNVPTGIKPLTKPDGTSLDYTALIDTIFGYVQSNNDNEKYNYDKQINLGLEITEEANTYTINFDANGGEGTMDSIVKKTYNASDNKLPANKFTKSGYTFAGWKITEASYADTIYQYPKYANAEEYPDLIQDDFKSIKVDTTKAPYNETYADKAEYIPENHNETVTMTAKWKAKDGYTVKYDTNGGSGITDAAVKWTDQVTPGSNPTKDGYKLTDWKCIKIGDTDISKNPVTVEADTTYEAIMKAYAEQTGEDLSDEIMNITLQAQWEEKNDYTIKYNTNSSESTINDKTGVKWTDKVLDKIKGIVISKTGYTFDKWMCDSTAVSEEMTYGSLAVEDIASITLDAQWTANDYTVKFEANGGSESMADQTLTYDETATLNANKFTKTGYTFKEWNTEADGTGTPYKDKAEVKNLATEEGAEVKLYAQWTENDYTVKFNTDGGSAIDDKTVKWEDNVLADVEDPTKDGFTFKGWKYGEADVTADTAYSALAEDDAIEELTLTAQWEEVVVPVDEPDDKSPTGDNMNITLLMALLLLSGCGIAGAGLYRRNHVK